MWKKSILLIIGFCGQLVWAKDPKPTSYPDVKEPELPVLSIRSLNTGAPLSNKHYGERNDKNLHWQLRDVSYQNKRYVQFQALDTNKCLTVSAGVKECSNYDETLFILTPTDTGAFILMTYPSGVCLYSSGFGQFDLEHCNRNSLLKGRPVDIRFLWALVPPFGKSKLLKVPVK